MPAAFTDLPRVHLSGCPVCGSADLACDTLCRDFLVSGLTFEIWKCAQCGFLFTQDAPSPEVIGRFYQSEDYISHSDTRKGLLNKLYHFGRSFMLRRKCRSVIQHAGRSKGNILDIGSGTGHFLHAMQIRGWDVAGVEPDAGARQTAHAAWKLEENQYAGIFDIPETKHGTFDVITMYHVLEHVPDLHAYLQKIFSLLKPEGLLVIAIPNAGSWDRQYYGAYWAAYDIPRHLWHFTPPAFERLMQSAFFRITGTERMPLDPLYIAWLSEKHKKDSAFTFPKGIFIGSIALLAGIFNKKKSSSLIYYLRKINTR